jgi:hypothetical protein
MTNYFTDRFRAHSVVTKAVKKQGNQVVALKLLQPPEEAKGQGKAGVRIPGCTN